MSFLLQCFHYKFWIYACWLALHCTLRISSVILRFNTLKMLCIKFQYQWIYLRSFLRQDQLNEGIFWRGQASGLEAMLSTAVEEAQVWEWLFGLSPRSWCNPDISQSEISELSEGCQVLSLLVQAASETSGSSQTKCFPGEAGVEAAPSMLRGGGLWALGEGTWCFSAEIEVPRTVIFSVFALPSLTSLAQCSNLCFWMLPTLSATSATAQSVLPLVLFPSTALSAPSCFCCWTPCAMSNAGTHTYSFSKEHMSVDWPAAAKQIEQQLSSLCVFHQTFLIFSK